MKRETRKGVKGRTGPHSASQGHAQKMDPVTVTRRVGPVYLTSFVELMGKLSPQATAVAFAFVQQAQKIERSSPEFVTIDVQGMAAANGLTAEACVDLMYEISEYLLPTGAGGNWMPLLTPVCVNVDETGTHEVVVFAPPAKIIDSKEAT